MANEVRLIDANAAMLNTHKEIYWTESEAAAVRNFLAHQPTIDQESLRPKGRWRKYSSDEWICTNCGYDKYCDTLDGGVLPDFCEGCGADMREG